MRLLWEAHKIMGPSSGTFSEPNTSILRKKVVIAELARARIGGCVKPKGMTLDGCAVHRSLLS